MKKTILLTVIASLALAATAAAKTPAKFYVPRAHHACKAHYVKRTVRIAKRHHGKLVRRHHRIVMVRQTRCVLVAPTTAKPPVTSPAPTLAAPTVVRAGIDPSFTQDPSDNLRVTWSYSVSSNGALPDGTLTLTVQEPSKTGSSGGCTINVGGDVTGGTCTQELPHYGAWNVTVSYSGASTTVAPATSTDTEDIEPLPVPPPPPPAPITLTKVWGTDAPSSQPIVSATVIGSTASVQVTDSNFEGAASVVVSDQNGDSCTATVNGSSAACQMQTPVAPTSFHVAYPGGASTQTTNVAGALVTTTWPAQTVAVSNPSVTIQQATVEECGGSQQGGPIWTNPSGTCSFGNPGTWSNPIETTVNRQIQLDAVAFGSLASDRDPTHGDGQVSGFLTFTVTGGIEGTDYTASDFQNGPDNSTDCAEVTTQSFDAGTGTSGPDEPTGTCFLKFQTAGTYTVTVSYTSLDPDYATVRNVDSETIDVLP
jgi:hypothetical protein